jgi:hypothetical protein
MNPVEKTHIQTIEMLSSFDKVIEQREHCIYKEKRERSKMATGTQPQIA